MKKLPVKLATDPILEAVFELRFEPARTAGADLLLGTMYTALEARFPTLTRLAIADIPQAAFTKLEPSFKYLPRIRLSGESFSLLLGDNSLIVAAANPYAGWPDYQTVISEVLNHVKGAGVVKTVERFSLKYVNLLEAESIQAQFGKIRFTSELGERNLLTNLTTIRTEFIEDGFTNIVELNPQSTAEGADGKKSTGLLLSVDTISLQPDDFWNHYHKQIDAAHTVEKRIFFSILTQETIAAYGAVYQEVTL